MMMTKNRIALFESECPVDGLEDFFPQFISNRLNELAQMRAPTGLLNLTTVMKIAHKWIGFSAPYGFNHLADLGVNLEDAAKRVSFDECEKIILEVQEYLNFKSQLFRNSK
jgi:hypothetical protein